MGTGGVPSYSYEPLSGSEICPHLDELGEIRIAVFREYPYLYEGDLSYERNYLIRYAECERSLVVLLKHEGKLIGATTCLPLEDEIEEFRSPFEKAGFTPGEIFYFGESIILPSYRGMGAGKEFFRFREAHAHRLGPFRYTTFCAVDRPEDHPERPADYRPLHEFWNRMGYQRHDELKCELPWQEHGSTEEVMHHLTFWIKDHVKAEGP